MQSDKNRFGAKGSCRSYKSETKQHIGNSAARISSTHHGEGDCSSPVGSQCNDECLWKNLRERTAAYELVRLTAFVKNLNRVPSWGKRVRNNIESIDQLGVRLLAVRVRKSRRLMIVVTIISSSSPGRFQIMQEFWIREIRTSPEISNMKCSTGEWYDCTLTAIEWSPKFTSFWMRSTLWSLA